MELTYTAPTDPAQLDPIVLSEQLTATLEEAQTWLALFSEVDASHPIAEGKWSTKQVIGHLIDSAVNNLARIVRLENGGSPALTSYGADAWVASGRYQQRPWHEVLELWTALNRQIAWVVGHLHREALLHAGTIDGSPVTLGFVVEDYIAHMNHHFVALRRPRKSAGKQLD